MPRKPLQPGELGTPTLRRVSRNHAGKPIADPRGKEWEGAVRIGQHSGRPKLVRRTGTTKQEALDNTLHAAQQHVTVAITPQLQHVTLTTLWEAYQKTPKWDSLSVNTRKQARFTIRQAQESSPRLWTTPLGENIPLQTWQQYFNDFTKQHGTISAQKMRAFLTQALKPYSDIYDPTFILRTTIPTGVVVKPRHKLDRDRIFTPEEFTQLREHLKQYRHTQNAYGKLSRALLLNTFTGMRISEVGQLTWENFSPDHTTVTGYSAKTRRPYPTKTLPQWATELVNEQNPDQPHPFQLPGNISTIGRRVLDDAGFTWASTHTIRRTVGSRIFDQHGARVAAAWLAHANVATTLGHYVKAENTLLDLPVNF